MDVQVAESKPSRATRLIRSEVQWETLGARGPSRRPQSSARPSSASPRAVPLRVSPRLVPLTCTRSYAPLDRLQQCALSPNPLCPSSSSRSAARTSPHSHSPRSTSTGLPLTKSLHTRSAFLSSMGIGARSNNNARSPSRPPAPNGPPPPSAQPQPGQGYSNAPLPRGQQGNGAGAQGGNKQNSPLYLCYPFVKAALVKGNFKTIVALPKCACPCSERVLLGD